MKNVLTKEQMQPIIEAGIDTSKASMCWVKMADNTFEVNTAEFVKSRFPNWREQSKFGSFIFTFDLSDILEVLPKKICDKYHFVMQIAEEGPKYVYMGYCTVELCGYLQEINIHFMHKLKGINPLQAAYQMLLWCIENGHFKAK